MKIKFNWGHGIIIAWAIFAIWLISFLFFSINQKNELIVEDYYEKEKAFLTQINKTERAMRLSEAVKMKYNNGNLELKFPIIEAGLAKGKIHFIRPSNAKFDRTLNISTDSLGEQVVNLSSFAKGLWIVKLDWYSSNPDSSYFFEDEIIFH